MEGFPEEIKSEPALKIRQEVLITEHEKQWDEQR